MREEGAEANGLSIVQEGDIWGNPKDEEGSSKQLLMIVFKMMAHGC